MAFVASVGIFGPGGWSPERDGAADADAGKTQSFIHSLSFMGTRMPNLEAPERRAPAAAGERNSYNRNNIDAQTKRPACAGL